MGTMDSVLYLPEEVLNFTNYPEIKDIVPDISALIAYASKANTALQAYLSGVSDKIDLNISELSAYIVSCRNICNIIGTAPNVCFDILVDMRELQDILQTFAYVKNRYGNQYVGSPTTGV